MERARPREQLSAVDHASLLATRAARKIDAGELQHKIVGQGYGGSYGARPHNLAADPIFRMPLFLLNLRL